MIGIKAFTTERVFLIVHSFALSSDLVDCSTKIEVVTVAGGSVSTVCLLQFLTFFAARGLILMSLFITVRLFFLHLIFSGKALVLLLRCSFILVP